MALCNGCDLAEEDTEVIASEKASCDSNNDRVGAAIVAGDVVQPFLVCYRQPAVLLIQAKKQQQQQQQQATGNSNRVRVRNGWEDDWGDGRERLRDIITRHPPGGGEASSRCQGKTGRKGRRGGGVKMAHVVGTRIHTCGASRPGGRHAGWSDEMRVLG
eukprot:360430-Chlamydomonas_euryale.AAC.1